MRRTIVLIALLVAGAAGACIGWFAHAGFLMATHDGLSLMGSLTARGSRVRPMLVLAGALGALLLAGSASRLLRLRDVARDVAGIAIGASAGFLLYVLGYLSSGAARGNSSTLYALRYWGVLDTFTVAELAAAILGGIVGLVVMRFRWRVYGVLAYVAFTSIVAGYFAYVFNVALPAVPAEALPFSLVLLWAEGMSLAMVVVHTFYGLDNFVKRTWTRTPDLVSFSPDYLPKVAFHYACFNEPPEIVFDSLSRFKDIDYPRDRFVVFVCDDSTDEKIRKPIEEYCRKLGFTYIHRKDRRGFKAGALNNALRLTPADVEVISVVDADYHVEAEFLRETVGYFIDPALGFLQTPQDYRNIHQSFLTKQYYFADGYFYRAIMPSRNEVNSTSFCGTMGMVRREALERVGGWAEDHVTEDAELSVRLLAAGWRSLYVPKTFGKGLIPPTFDAYKKQHHRWAFGGVKVLKTHLKKILHSPMTIRQRFDWLVSGLHWFDGVYVVIIAASVAAIAIGEIRQSPVMIYHRNEIALLGLVPLFLLADGFTRLHLALRRSMNLSAWGTLKVMGVWYAIKFVHMRAAIKALLGFKQPFVRTPKAPSGRPSRSRALARAVRLAPFETICFLGMTSLAIALPTLAWDDFPHVALQRVLLLLWLLTYALIFLAAPLYAYLSYRSFQADAELPTLAPGFRLPGPRRGPKST